MPFDEDSFRSASSDTTSQNDSFKSTSRLLERDEDSFKRASSFKRSRLSGGAVETVQSRLSGGAVKTVNALRLCAVAATTFFLLLLFKRKHKLFTNPDVASLSPSKLLSPRHKTMPSRSRHRCNISSKK